ncbi:hypothetical protein LBK6_04155 [Leptospira borgpetersenii serovar Hardjo]|nr:hypothetical protein LBK6_04155 [Leptospira borgpetersenii serovar Hardjo]AWV71577.1 hypothetical protein B9T54_04515 [Leptospira borgpetersenii serovar Hardjo-bovis]TQE51657.1 hypothetical protein FFZ95_13360 [Leptospira borgpetersenii]AMX60815.1 hypothetical protein LBK9_04100 [Leptospira borgpetersenii serovar Hardjo]AMX64060.1 hypothetical protein LBK30_04145 [Leptospira borgpetersenii serovar Hardjo]
MRLILIMQDVEISVIPFHHRIFPGGKVPFFQTRFFSPRENSDKLHLIHKLEIVIRDLEKAFLNFQR